MIPRILAVVLAGLVLASCGTAPEQPAATTTPEPQHYNYVALGDSYASMGSTEAATTGPEECIRSADNYPANVLASDRVTGTDASCQGAVTGDVLANQVDEVTDSTTLVTVSIGGNDIGFGDISGCFLEAMNAGQPSNCGAIWDETIAGRMAELPAQLDAVYEAVDERADDATVLATGYIPLLAEGDQCPAIEALSAADRAWVVSLTEQLNDVVADTAQRHGGEMVLPENTEEHSACAAPAERWVDIFGAETGSYPMHPTAAGQEAMADAVLQEL